MKKCYCCGADVPDQSKFCPKCGKPMEVTQDLIDRARTDDPDAQTELYERTYKTVYSRIRAKVPDADTVMDIMQETYLRAFASLDQLQKAETFPSWLLTIASRQVCNWYKKNGKENENVQMSQLEYENNDTISDEDDLLEMPEYREDFSPDESLDRTETGRLLSEILDTLPEDQRIILTMRYYDEMSLQEISDELGVNLSTVKSRLTAGKKKVEAKVLELEKSGTKLYSLGPIAFLVYLLHHAELFAPAISANTVIGLAAAGAAGTGAGGAAAAHVTAGAAAKAAVVTAAKGVSVKVIAIAAAAVVVVGGGVTAGVLISNNNRETAEVSDAPESVGTEEPSESAVPAVIDSPSVETVMEMAEDLNKWIANSDLGGDPIGLDLDTACELSAVLVSECGYTDGDGTARIGTGDYDGYLSTISESALDQCLHDLFGTEYQASDFQNTEASGRFQAECPDYRTGLSGYLIRNDDGEFCWYYTGWDDAFAVAGPAEVTDISPVDSEEETCTATVRYDWYISDDMGEQKLDGSADVTFRLKYDENARYSWVITAVQEGAYTEPDGRTIKSITESSADGSSTLGEREASVVQDTYDVNGNILTTTGYDSNGKVIYSEEHTYNSDGIELSCAYYDSDGQLTMDYTCDTNGNMLISHEYAIGITGPFHTDLTYDDDGNCLTITRYDDSLGTTEYLYVYTYDNDGNMLTYTYYLSDGSVSYREEYTYDNDGNMLSLTGSYGNGEVDHRTEYTYDENGNTLSCFSYSGDGSLSSRWESTYDSEGNELTSISYGSDGTVTYREEHTYTYDNIGNMLTSISYDANGNITSRKESTYDGEGNMLTETYFDDNGNINGQYIYEYEYYNRFPGELN